MNQDKDVVKIGKKEYVQSTKLNWKAGDNETLIHLDLQNPKLRGYLPVNATRDAVKPCKKYHSNRLVFDPKTKKLRCSICGRVPKK